MRIGKVFRVELEIAPRMSAHPEAIKVEDADGDVNIAHSIEVRSHRALVVTSQEGGREPKTV